VQKLRIFVSAKKAHDFIMMICQRATAPISREFVGKVKMQSDIQFIFFRQLRRALGIFHENHRTDRRSPPSFVTSKGGIGFGHRAAPVISIDDKHSIGGLTLSQNSGIPLITSNQNNVVHFPAKSVSYAVKRFWPTLVHCNSCSTRRWP